MTKSLQYRSLFYDKEIEKEFSDNGFAIVRNKVDISKIIDLKVYFNGIFKNIILREGFSTGFDYFDIDTRFKNHDFILKTIHNLVEEICIDCEVYLSNYMIKTTEKEYCIDIHQNWSFVEEDKYTSLVIWIPLQDVDETNGCMYFIPGSDKWEKGIRGNNIPWQYENRKQELLKQMIPLPMKAGDAVIFDDATIHYTSSNKTNRPRISIAQVMIPKEAQPIFYTKNFKTLEIEKYVIADDFYMNFTNIYLKK